MDGKAMIVAMSRRIAVALYNEIIALRPEWHGDDDDKGALKIVMTGSASDPLEWQNHIRSKQRREDLANRFRDSADPFQIVIVRDMWLTGFDAPSLSTMYVDKPMGGHGLMQAIARVNRVFKFYNALGTNDSAVKVLGDDALRTIARELVATVRANVTIDWTVRENVRAQLRVLVKRILRKYGYPPDMQEKATQTVLEQAELLSEGWEGWAA
jgi:type I site-specific restriction-modification system R (restriction) subunit